jgi:hypothetical protein
MPFARSIRLALTLAFACLIFASLGRPTPQDSQQSQPQADSVADAARRAREQKGAATKASKVITDDDLDNKHPKPGAQGLDVGAPPAQDSQPPSQAAVAAAVASEAAASAATTEAKPKDDERGEVADLKEALAQLQKEYDLMQRELSLDQDALYSKPDYSNDKAGLAKVTSEKQQTAAKQQELDALKTRLAASLDLESRKKSGSTGSPTQPQ